MCEIVNTTAHIWYVRCCFIMWIKILPVLTLSPGGVQSIVMSMSVYLFAGISRKSPGQTYQIFLTCWLWPWLGLSEVALRCYVLVILWMTSYSYIKGPFGTSTSYVFLNGQKYIAWQPKLVHRFRPNKDPSNHQVEICCLRRPCYYSIKWQWILMFNSRYTTSSI